MMNIDINMSNEDLVDVLSNADLKQFIARANNVSEALVLKMILQQDGYEDLCKHFSMSEWTIDDWVTFNGLVETKTDHSDYDYYEIYEQSAGLVFQDILNEHVEKCLSDHEMTNDSLEHSVSMYGSWNELDALIGYDTLLEACANKLTEQAVERIENCTAYMEN